MRLYSTRKQAPVVSFQEALFAGQAKDGGLYMPETFPVLRENELAVLAELSYRELACELGLKFLGGEIGKADLEAVMAQAYSFEPKLQELEPGLYCLELFHGPTLSFKDFGAQFMAKTMGHFAAGRNQKLTILVATSGDTGSAVAHAYHRVEGIRIVLLYPSGKVSVLQERQFTTLGDNVQALEIQGTFDDCQALVKQAFTDAELQKKLRLSSANSINIGRLIPQSFYYVWAVTRVCARLRQEAVVCVPSGNFGNLTAGMFARKMGLPLRRFIAGVNANAVIPEYLDTGSYRPRPSLQTLSNAMDVGAPSNWERIRDLYGDSHERIKQELWSTSVDDASTAEMMRESYQRWSYVADPHTAVGLRAVERFKMQFPETKNCAFVTLSTAHPGKFVETVNEALSLSYELPERLQAVMRQEKKALLMPNNYATFKDFVWHTE